MRCVIDRATWHRGRIPVETPKLLTKFGRMCCLGFLGAACGLDSNDAVGVDTPRDAKEAADWPEALFRQCDFIRSEFPCDWEDVLTRINDCEDVDDATREDWIAEGFRTVLGVDVEFVGEYPEEVTCAAR